MWNVISYLILGVELLLLGSFAIGKLRKKKLNETIVFLALVYVVNLALYIVPFVHSITVMGVQKNPVFGILECITNAGKLFVGSVNTGAVAAFTLEVPVFTYTYLAGALLALLATVSTTISAFGHTIANAFRLAKALGQKDCDVVFGQLSAARRYAKHSTNAVVLVEDGKKETAVALMEAGCIVLRKKFTIQLLKSRYFKSASRYNFVCFGDDSRFLHRLEIFTTFKKTCHGKDNMFLYIEVDADKAETVRREIIQGNDLSAWVTTFCADELMARSFTEAHPITQHLPADFIRDCAIRPDRQINVVLLGFGDLSRELYRQSVLNNQLVAFRDGQYRVHPIHYHIYDPAAQEAVWDIGGLQRAMSALDPAAHFPLAEMPYVTRVVRKDPALRDTLGDVAALIREQDAFGCVIVDAGDEFCNIQTGARLRAMLNGAQNFHLFVRSTAAYVQSDDHTTYYGDFDQILSHDVIVDDSLAAMAKKINEIYCGDMKKAMEKWEKMDYFTRYSNLYSAMNLRLKLQLLGLDYEKGEGCVSVMDRLQHRREYAYSDYFAESRRNAMLAQEHARWNAYHLLHGYLPMEKVAVVADVSADRVKFHTKDLAAEKHACLTTFRGLDTLSSHLAAMATQLTGKAHQAEAYDYYIYDEMLISSAEELAKQLGYCIKTR